MLEARHVNTNAQIIMVSPMSPSSHEFFCTVDLNSNVDSVSGQGLSRDSILLKWCLHRLFLLVSLSGKSRFTHGSMNDIFNANNTALKVVHIMASRVISYKYRTTV